MRSAVVNGEDGERRDWEEEGVRGVEVEVVGKWRGSGEVPALVELDTESPPLGLSWSSSARLEMELSLLDEVEPSRFPPLTPLTEGFSPLSHISAGGGRLNISTVSTWKLYTLAVSVRPPII